ncbi:hypothetical protein GGR77_001589 [Xanthomonas translucens]
MDDHLLIDAKIKNSDAYQSLRSEQDVASCLERHGWFVRHSPYYVDLKTGKSRELDITGSGYWQKKLKAGTLTARVNLFVEVKTNRDFHIICAGLADEQSRFGANEYWIGYNEEARIRIEQRLALFQIEHQDIRSFLHQAENIAFPRHTMRTSALRLRPPPIESNFSSFRETNGKIEKDLDNSVLWRATSVLRSAIRSAQTDLVDGLESDLSIGLESARRRKIPYKSAMHSIESHACRINFYVPIVVTQSRIWSAISEEPTEVRWFRLVQYNAFGGTDDWVDVVNDQHLDGYLNSHSHYFDKAFRKVRAERWM